jgi:MATE family multidrug resistance protein
LFINLGEVEDKRFELFEPGGRVFKAPGTSLRLIKNVLDKVKRDLGNSPKKVVPWYESIGSEAHVTMNAKEWINKRRYRDVMRVSLPLVMSMAGTTVMEFTDRVFLANYSLNAIAAAMPAGLTAYLFIAFFLGIAGYLNVFIGQYTGAGAANRIGASLWQGIYFSILSGAALACLSFTAKPLFHLSGHSQEVQQLEVVYFRILCLGAGMNVVGTSLSCFYSGQGLTRPVMWINTAGMLFNIPLDYALINGLWIFPELGIMGAGIATVSSWVLITFLFGIFIFTKENNRRFGVWKNRSFERSLFIRLMKFGIPSAVQFCMDIFAFTFFVFMVGRVGKTELAITNIVLSINALAYMPAIGFSLGTSTLVGQSLGGSHPKAAIDVAKSTIHILLAYTFLLILVFVFAPVWVLGFFSLANQGTLEQAKLLNMGVALLRIVSVYLFFDALYMVYLGVLKGAGDTRFVMWSLGSISFLVMILPIYIGVEYFGAGLYFSWICVTFFIIASFLISYWRYRQGNWKGMRVIEKRDVPSNNL